MNTFSDAPRPGTGDWVGLNLGYLDHAQKRLTAIAYAPRTHFETRMIGGVFQGSNIADFSSGVVDLAPPIAAFFGDRFNIIPVSGSFRYVRYLSPEHGFGNISELQFFSGPESASKASDQ